MAGTQETKEVLDFVVQLAHSIESARADGSIGFSDVTDLVDVLMKVGAAFDGISEVPAEVKDLTEEEAAELNQHVKDTLDLQDDRAESITELSLDIGLKVYQLIQLLKTPAPADPAPEAA